MDRNPHSGRSLRPAGSRSLRGNVDRNDLDLDDQFGCLAVVPYVGTWIEIRNRASGW